MKKLNFALLAAVIALLVLPSTALAEDTKHKHCVCGSTSCASTTSPHRSIEWTAWDKAGSLPTEAGNYYLKQNVTLSQTWEPVSGTVLCLNGKTITCNAGNSDSTSPTIYVGYSGNGVAFTLTDCGTTGTVTHGSTYIGCGVKNEWTFNLWNGKITGNNTDGVAGGGVINGANWAQTATFNMYGGSITNNNTSASGGGVYVQYGTFNMYGGSITENTANQSGGGVRTSGTFTMSGGVISGNTAKWGGGGVYNGSTFTMSGGSITGNTNTNNSEGGGVYTSSSSTFTVSDNVNIAGNTANGDANNVYLSSNGTTNATIKVASEFAKDTTTGAVTARIGITSPVPASKPTVVEGSTDMTVFSSDNPDCELQVEDTNKLKLVPKSHAHCVCTKEGATETTHTHSTDTTWTGIDSLDQITKDGNYYLLQDVTITSAIKSGTAYFGWNVKYDVNLCLNGHDIVMKNPSSITSDDGYKATQTGVDVINISTGNTLTLTDCKTVAGKITHSNSKIGRGIANNGTLNLWNGNITGNTAENESGNNCGGGVLNCKYFNMYGGNISGNTAPGSGGGVWNYAQGGTFNLYGGSITNNKAGSGGGVLVSIGAFNMTGGSIKDNTATGVGGGVCNNGTSGSYSTNVSGGEITNNKAENGGGIYNAGALTVSDTAKITNNTESDGTTKDNVYLARTVAIKVKSSLTTDAYIGVSAEYGPVENSGIDVKIATVTKAEDLTYFHYDSPTTAGIVYCDGGTTSGGTCTLSHAHAANTLWLSVSAKLTDPKTVKITLPDDVTSSSGNLEQTVNVGAAITNIVLTAQDGYYFKAADISTLLENIEKKGLEVTPTSDSETITISGTPTADVTIAVNDITVTEKAERTDKPTNLTAVAPTSAAGKGSISGTTAEMEYRENGSTGGWTACTGTSIAVAGGKTYEVRYKETVTQKASEAVSVTVPAYDGKEPVPVGPTAKPDTTSTPIVTPRPYSGGSNSSGNTYSWYFNPTPTPVPVAVPVPENIVLPKTGDMTIFQSILSLLGLL